MLQSHNVTVNTKHNCKLTILHSVPNKTTNSQSYSLHQTKLQTHNLTVYIKQNYKLTILQSTPNKTTNSQSYSLHQTKLQTHNLTVYTKQKRQTHNLTVYTKQNYKLTILQCIPNITTNSQSYSLHKTKL